MSQCECIKTTELAVLDHKFTELVAKMEKQSTQLDIIIGKLPSMEIKLDRVEELEEELKTLAKSHYAYRDKFNYWFARGVSLWAVLVFAGAAGAWIGDKVITRIERQSEKEAEELKYKAREEEMWKKKITDQLQQLERKK